MNQILRDVIESFCNEFPLKIITRVDISNMESESIVKIKYLDNGSEGEYSKKVNHNRLSTLEVNQLKTRIARYKMFEDENFFFMPYFDDKEKVLMLHQVYHSYDVYIMKKFKGKPIRLVDSKTEMDYYDLIVYLTINPIRIDSFYSDMIDSNKFYDEIKKFSLNEKLFLIYKSCDYNQILPAYWKSDLDKHGYIDYALLWKQGKFLPDINIKEPIIFDALVVKDSFHTWNQDLFAKHLQIHNDFRRIYYNRIREKYRIINFDFNYQTKNTHYINSILKFYSILNNNDWFMLHLNTLSTIRSISHPRIKTIIEELVNLEVISIDTSSKPFKYKVLQ